VRIANHIQMRINIENDFRYHARAKNSDWVIQSKLIQYDRKLTIAKNQQTTGLKVAKKYDSIRKVGEPGNSHLSHLILSQSLHLSHLIAINE